MKDHSHFYCKPELIKVVIVWLVAFSFHSSFAQFSDTGFLDGKPLNSETILWLCDSALSAQNNDSTLAVDLAQLALRKAMEWDSNPEALNRAKNTIGEIIKKKSDSKHYNIIIDLNTAKALISMESYSAAELLLRKALITSKEQSLRILEGQVLDAYRELYEKIQNFELALDYYRKKMEIDKEIQRIEIEEVISNLNKEYETEKQQKKIADLERQNTIERSLRIILSVIASSFILILFIVLLFQYQKRRKDRIISELELQKLSIQIITKSNEITTYTLNFLQKNQLMEDLKEQINDLKSSSTINKNKELTRINRIVDNTFRSDEEWKTFQITFDQMHDGFFKDLKKEFPDISNAELKLCALLRLNMNLKESAKILGIAPDSVKTARYRLRKKLGLKTEDNLVDFLISFEKPENH